LEEVHKQLADKDSCFKSVHIDDSNDSRDLCAAHSQRIICNAICEDIWKPFCSEFTFSQPDISRFLGNIADELDQSGHGRRVATVWTALTMQALESLQVNSIESRASESKESDLSAGSARAESVINRVFSVLAPLVSSSQTHMLRADLLAMAESAIDVWKKAQASGLTIKTSLQLDRKHREEWRSRKYDPASNSHESNNGMDTELTFETHPRIFTLFPRITAREMSDMVTHGTSLPGSWPAEKNLLTCIHEGKGLPEWSPLVVRGKTEQEKTADFLKKTMENAKKQIRGTRRPHGRTRMDSSGSMTSGPSSPSELWKREGVAKVSEN
jgi:hypothetical protein